MEFSIKRNSFLIVNKNSSIIVDPDSDNTKYSICLYTKKIDDLLTNRPINRFDETGEYEVGDISFQAITTNNITVYLIEIGANRIAVVSNWTKGISIKEIEILSEANILLLESNGNEIKDISKLISDVDPNLLILKSTDKALVEIEKELGLSTKQEVDKYKLGKKEKDNISEESPIELVVLQ